MSAAAQMLPDREHDWLDELEKIAAQIDELPSAARDAVRATTEAIVSEEPDHAEAARTMRLLTQIAGPPRSRGLRARVHARKGHLDDAHAAQ